MDALHSGLTDAQRQAVEHIHGPLLILAGPGSGKTRVITHRIAHMLHSGIPAWQIAALTFTNKAADEMRSRLETLAPGQPVWMGTFHRFCARLLRRYGSLVGLPENYSIYDSNDSKQALKRAIEAAGVSTSHTPPEKIGAAISRAKNRLVTPEMLEGQALRPTDQVAARVYPVYQRQLLISGAVDFDDLLLHVARLLYDTPELRAELDARYRYILVDEYQDTNLAQYAIVRSLSVDYPNLAVTGDPDQSIYGWRGADLNNILDFERDYPQVRVVRLEQNYRSTPNILRVADTLIRNNTRRKHKELFTERDEGAPVRLRIYEDGYREADDLADQIAAGVSSGRRRPADYAIFCRTTALTRTLEHALRSRGLPYQLTGAVEFYQRKEIKDLLAFLHLINNPGHDVACLRVINTPARGIGKTTVARLQQYADQQRIPLVEAARQARSIESLSKRSASLVARFVAIYDRISAKSTAALEDLLLYLLEETGYRQHLEKVSVEGEDNSPLANVDELVSAAVEFDRAHPEGGALEAFLEQVSLVSATDDWDGQTDAVSLMTLHAAKGLEFPCVFIVAVEDGLLPHSRSRDDPAQFEEERRLLFVGITRAEEELQLSTAKWRSFRGDMRPAVASPFLMELPRGEMQITEPDDAAARFAAGPSDGDEWDQGYPDAWDDFGDSSPGDDEIAAETLPGTTPQRAAGPATRPVQVQTAADLLAHQQAGGQFPPGLFQLGMVVTHPTYGSGRIVDLTGRGPKRTATVDFFSDGEQRKFRLAFANLVPEEE